MARTESEVGRIRLESVGEDDDEGRLQLGNDSILSYNRRRAGQLISCWKQQRAAPTQPTTLLVPAQGPLHDTL